MYKIIKPDGVTVTTEKPNFIRVHSNGCYILCPREKAEGIAYGGTPYLFKDGVIVYEDDGGKTLDDLTAENMALNEHLAETDEVAIDLFEASLAQEEINAEQDEAIITIYEMMEGINNG